MTDVTRRAGLSKAAHVTFMGALLLFVITIVIGILNGIDVWEPEHDTLITHVHAGTLGWITLGVSGIALLMFSDGRDVSADEAARATTLAKAMVGGVTLYVAAFLAGDTLFDDRIQRPIGGTVLLVVVVWFLVWLWQARREYADSNPARTGILLAWISLIVGAVLGIILGLYISNGEIPGLSDDVAGRVAEAHPPAMLIGYLLLAAFAAIEWLLHGDKESTRPATIQMWLLFVAGVVINIAFMTGQDDALAGPANLAMIVAVVMLLVRSRGELAPAGWRGAGIGTYARVATLSLVAALALLTILIFWFITDAIDFEALTPAQYGVGLSFDHIMFIGVMTNVIFGVLATRLGHTGGDIVDRVVLWGVNLGIVGFALGLITTTQWLKRISTPIMGLALLHGIAVYFLRLRSESAEA